MRAIAIGAVLVSGLVAGIVWYTRAKSPDTPATGAKSASATPLRSPLEDGFDPGTEPFALSVQSGAMTTKLTMKPFVIGLFGRPHLIVSSDPLFSCATGHPPWGGERLMVKLAPGPGRSFFVGEVIRLPTTFSTTNQTALGLRDDFFVIPTPQLRFRLKSFATTAKTFEAELVLDAQSRGAAFHGAGTLRGEVCHENDDDYSKVTDVPAVAPDGSVAGTFEGDPFEPASILAVLAPASEGGQMESIVFSAQAATCADIGGGGPMSSTPKGRSFVLHDPPIAGELRPIGFILPAGVEAITNHGDSVTFSGGSGEPTGWVRFDRIELGGGGVVEGSLVAEYPVPAPGKSSGLSGRFRATVCRRK
ncbi:MAG: hypothetical protein ABI175_13190, partial [Polyangiales bacterium]